MKKIFISILVVTIALGSILYSCSKNTNSKEEETPKVLQQGYTSSKFRSNDYDHLVESLYSELVNKTPELKKLEDDLDIYDERMRDSLKVFADYNLKSNAYYGDALYEIKSMNDSVLKKKIYEIVENSKKNYDKKNAKIEALLGVLNKNDISIRDYHKVLKIMLTLPIIEKYQDENLPGSKPIDNLSKEQSVLIKKINELTPKY